MAFPGCARVFFVGFNDETCLRVKHSRVPEKGTLVYRNSVFVLNDRMKYDFSS